MNKLEVCVKREGDLLIVGESPQLIVNLKNQENYLLIDEKRLPYKKRVELSSDLLAGKRQNVYHTAIRHYYMNACKVAEGLQLAASYRSKVNTLDREIK